MNKVLYTYVEVNKYTEACTEHLPLVGANSSKSVALISVRKDAYPAEFVVKLVVDDLCWTWQVLW